ncbi:hypothetical protein QZH41_013477, partial [Actinostola sp. cb2023]
MEVLLCTSDGQVIFLKSDGTPVQGQKILQIPPLKLRKHWYIIRPEQNQGIVEPSMDAKFADESEFIPRKIKDEVNINDEDISWNVHQTSLPPSGLSADGFHVYVDVHVLSTPVIADFNQDGLENELVVPVNFYFDQTKYVTSLSSIHPKDSPLPAKDLENYLGSGIVVFYLDTGLIIHKTVLEVTKISVADANDDGHLELLTVDGSGNVACIDLTGKRVWESRVSGSPTSGIRVADVNGDNLLDVVFATHDGYLWVLNGDNGKVLSGWPIKLPGEIRATVLVTKLRPGDGSGLDLLSHSAVAADLLPWKQGLEIIVGSTDGSIICLGDATITTATHRSDMIDEGLFSWTAETLPCSGTTFYSGKVGVAFTNNTKQTTHFTGSSFPVEFEITDLQATDLRWNNYRTKIFIGNKMLAFNKTITTPGVHQENLPVPPLPGKVVMVIKMTTPNQQCFQDSFHISFNTHQWDDIHWYLLAPFLTMSCLLLVLHGHALPDEVLPTIMRKKP